MSRENTLQSVNETVASWRDEMLGFLPTDLNIDSYMKSVSTALINNIDIFIECTPESIKRACIKAANDGLRPDGKEGALVKYWNKDAPVPGSNTKGANEAQWMPMVFGIRKKAREKDGIIIKAMVVHKADDFEWYEGDDGRIEHKPAPLDVDAGEVIGSYSIFMKEDGTILHREVMRKKDIESVRAASKSPNSPAWSKWFGEMAKKAAVNRGAKSVPMSDSTRQVIDRDNDFFDFSKMQDVSPKPAGVSLEGRFGGGQSGAGFSGGNVARELEHGSKDNVDVDLIKNNGEQVKTGKAAQDGGQKGGRQRQQNEDRGGGSKAQDDDPVKQETFENYSKELMRYASVENIDKGHEEFWAEAGGKPTSKDKIELTKFIRHMHTRRVNGEANVDEVKNEVAKAIDELFKL